MKDFIWSTYLILRLSVYKPTVVYTLFLCLCSIFSLLCPSVFWYLIDIISPKRRKFPCNVIKIKIYLLEFTQCDKQRAFWTACQLAGGQRQQLRICVCLTDVCLVVLLDSPQKCVTITSASAHTRRVTSTNSLEFNSSSGRILHSAVIRQIRHDKVKQTGYF